MIALVFFYLASAVILGGALTVVLSRNIVYAAFGLIASLILIYGGAIVIVIIFALMLTKLEDFRTLSDHKHWPLALVSSLVILGLITSAAFYLPVNLGSRTGVNLSVLAHNLFSQWAIPFEIASLVLLIALIGGVIMVREDK